MADADGRRLNGGRGLGAALAADFDPWAAVGGVRGLVETTVPGIIFLVVYTVTKDVGLSVVAPLGVALGCLAVRLAQRIDVLPVLGGLLGIAASALWAWRTGRASDYFTLGLMTNAAYLAGLLLSLAVRRPAPTSYRPRSIGCTSQPPSPSPPHRWAAICFRLRQLATSVRCDASGCDALGMWPRECCRWASVFRSISRICSALFSGRVTGRKSTTRVTLRLINRTVCSRRRPTIQTMRSNAAASTRRQMKNGAKLSLKLYKKESKPLPDWKRLFMVRLLLLLSHWLLVLFIYKVAVYKFSRKSAI